MPARIWTQTREGELRSIVETQGQVSASPEDFSIAESLDVAIDGAFDQAADLLGELKRENVSEKFTANWAVGRAFTTSGLLKHPALSKEKPEFFYKAAAAKARFKARSDGSEESRWAPLRPSFEDKPTGREGRLQGRPDHFEMCIWLAEQEFGDAVKTFGGSTRNVWQMMDRKTLRPLVLRQALRAWLGSLLPEEAEMMTSARVFPELMKALRERWPARGLRPARQPIHYSEVELRGEIARIAELAGILGRSDYRKS